MRTVLAAIATALPLLLSTLALAQQQQAPVPDQAPKDGAVVPGQAPQAAPTGERAPTLTNTDTQSIPLSQALEQVWNSAVDLQGAPIAGPSGLALPGSGRQPPQPPLQ